MMAMVQTQRYHVGIGFLVWIGIFTGGTGFDVLTHGHVIKLASQVALAFI